MKLPIAVLKRFLLEDVSFSPEELADKLTNQGLTVERISYPKELFEERLFSAVLTEIQKANGIAHCTVKCGSEIYQVKVEEWGVPPLGSKVMINLSDRNRPSPVPWKEGKNDTLFPFLIVIDSEIPEGEPLFEILIGNDPILDLEITSNRGDCLSVAGLAREIGAGFGLEPTLPEVTLNEEDWEEKFTLENQDEELCPFYSGKLIRDVMIKPSPWWLIKELCLFGLRPINNVVDITNLVMMETGQPLHAFDAAKIRGKKVIVRRAFPGEKIWTLDGVERTLNPSHLVIADATSAIAIAGVIGGLDSEVTYHTSSIFLEAAIFAPYSVRKTSRQLGLRTEASARFERKVDPGMVLFASRRALHLMQRLAGGRINRQWLLTGSLPREKRVIACKKREIEEILGFETSQQEVVSILERLGFEVNSDKQGSFQVTVPSWRHDVTQEVDIAEEIGRIAGYHKIPATIPSFPFDPGNPYPHQKYEEKIRSFLVNRGLKEIISLSLINQQTAEAIGFKERLVTINNPITKEHSVLRPALLCSAIEVIKNNITLGNPDLGLFEIGKTFSHLDKGADQLFSENNAIFVALCGNSRPLLWNKEGEQDFFTLKGLIEEVLEISGVDNEDFELVPRFYPFLEEPFSCELKVKGRNLGWIGKLSGELVKKFDFWGKVFVCELSLQELFELAQSENEFKLREIPAFPAAYRDISLVTDIDISWQQIQRIIRTKVVSEGIPVEKIEIFDLFQGKPLPPGKKGISVRIVFRSSQKTLDEAEVEEWISGIKSELKQVKGVHLREEFVTFDH
jgi:phenylalanyl-tRNA synthetase beta chain